MPSVLHTSIHHTERAASHLRSPAPEHTDGKLCLTGLHRLSLCCHTPLIHVFPLNCRYLENALELICTKCGLVVDSDGDFEVVNEIGERIWPL